LSRRENFLDQPRGTNALPPIDILETRSHIERMLVLAAFHLKLPKKGTKLAGD
jgi:hypothetical protein